MPLYEYQCDACGNRFESIQKFSDPLRTTCDKCGGALTKLVSSPAIQFKGSGWYITDYARAGKSEGAAEKSGGSGAPESSAPASSGDGKGEVKSESKAEKGGASKPESASASKSEAKDGSKGGAKPSGTGTSAG